MQQQKNNEHLHSDPHTCHSFPTMKPQAMTSLLIFLLLCVFRVLNTFLIRSYFDPDEVWQTLEPAYCAVFRPSEGFDCPGFTWEWKRRGPDDASDFITQSLLGPARTYLSVLPTHLFYRALQSLRLDTSWWVGRGPMLLYALTVAAPTDYAVWYCAKLLYKSLDLSFWCLFASLSAWFNAYSMVRTFANGQEAFLLMMSLCLVGKELLVYSDKLQCGRMWRARLAFFLGGLCVSIRGTSGVAYVPMGILLAWRENSWKDRLLYLFSICALFGLLGIGAACVVDFWFFGFPTLPFLGNFHFNVVLDFAALFGSHPWYWYLTAGIPAISGILLPFLLIDFFSMVSWSKGRRNLWVIVATYTVAMSMNAHKEFRFILPLLPIFCVLVGEKLQRTLGRNSRAVVQILGLFIFIMGNLLAVLYLGLFHQSGPISVNREILRLSQQATKHPSSASPVTFRVDYWTGSCHFGPLLSSLHSPPLRFVTRTLDCSPSCRSDPRRVCETEQFHQTPLVFLAAEYPEDCVVDDEFGDQTCSVGKALPSFVVTMSNYVDDIRDYLNGMGLYEVERYPQNMDGAKLFAITLGNGFDQNKGSRPIKLIEHVHISTQEVVLFAHETIVSAS